MDDDAVSLGGDDKDDLGDAPEYASTEQQAEARLADSDRSGRPADGAGDRDRSKSRERSPPGQASKSQLEPDRKNAEGATAENGPKLFCAICGERGHRFKACPHRIPDSEIPKGGCPICGDVSHRMFLCPRRKIDPDLVCPICKKKGTSAATARISPPRITPRRGASSAANAATSA